MTCFHSIWNHNPLEFTFRIDVVLHKMNLLLSGRLNCSNLFYIFEIQNTLMLFLWFISCIFCIVKLSKNVCKICIGNEFKVNLVYFDNFIIKGMKTWFFFLLLLYKSHTYIDYHFLYVIWFKDACSESSNLRFGI